MTHASAAHRALDAAAAEALARDRRRERAEAAQDRERLAADRDADGCYRDALAGSGDRFVDVDPVERRAAERDPPAYVGALLPSRLRNQDLRSMSRPRVLLAKLSVRTSSKGREYLSGWLGKASVVGFQGDPDKFGNPVWDVYVSEPEPKDGTATTAPRAPQQHQERAIPAPAGVDAGFDEMPPW
jgi:hypothetical protein